MGDAETFHLPLVVGGAVTGTCTVRARFGFSVEIWMGDDGVRGVGGDAFAAFDEARLAIEPALIRCFGTCLDVYPSGMCRDAGGGFTAYRLGPQRTVTETEGTFAPTDHWTPATVADQRLFFALWSTDLIPERWWQVRDQSWRANEGRLRWDATRSEVASQWPIRPRRSSAKKLTLKKASTEAPAFVRRAAVKKAAAKKAAPKGVKKAAARPRPSKKAAAEPQD